MFHLGTRKYDNRVLYYKVLRVHITETRNVDLEHVIGFGDGGRYMYIIYLCEQEVKFLIIIFDLYIGFYSRVTKENS